MKKSMLIFTTLIMLSCSSDRRDWTNATPTFEDFKTSSFCVLSSAQTRPNFMNTEFSVAEKQEIKKQYLGTSNSIHCIYSTATLSASTNGWRHIVINTQRGDIIGELPSANGIIYAKRSALIISDPSDDPKEVNSISQYWRIEEDQLKRIK